MVLPSAQYLQICTILTHTDCSSTKLLRLKNNFKDDINSQRVFERINSLTYLLKILEKRDVLGPISVHILKYIIDEVAPENMEIKNVLYSHEVAANVSDDNFHRIILNRSLGHNTRQEERGKCEEVVFNQFNERSIARGGGTAIFIREDLCEYFNFVDMCNFDDMLINVLPHVLPDPVQRINEMVKTSIGFKWKELARALSIPEGQIDNLEYQYRYSDVPRMVQEILSYHQEKCGNNYELWRSELQRSLDKARRKDLSEDIDDILKLHPINNH